MYLNNCISTWESIGGFGETFLVLLSHIRRAKLPILALNHQSIRQIRKTFYSTTTAKFAEKFQLLGINLALPHHNQTAVFRQDYQ
jgi:hypothetical protein